MSVATVANLVETLERLELLEPAHWQALGALRPRPSDPRDLAKFLLRKGWMTRFQATKILRGESDQLVQGPYLLVDQLGEGGMGQVYKARHQKLGRIVALKVIHQSRLTDAKAVSRFQREMQAVAQLQHPNIIQAFDAGETRTGYYLAMEYVDGVDLGRILKEKGRLPIHLCCEYVRQTALGLQHAHERGLVHRDIKPSNLLITAEPASAAASTGSASSDKPALVKILDLGLARVERSAAGDVLSQVTCENLVIGTPDYIAPEQAMRPHEVDPRADIYSLGCTFYHLLACRIPFPAQTVMEKLLKHKFEQPEPIESNRPEVPAAVRALVGQMMSKKPGDRPASAAIVAEVLQPFCCPSASDPAPEVIPTPEELQPTLQVATAPNHEVEPGPTLIAPTPAFETPRAFRWTAETTGRRGMKFWLLIGLMSCGLTGTLITLLLIIANSRSNMVMDQRAEARPTVPAATPRQSPPPQSSAAEREWLALLARVTRNDEQDASLRKDLQGYLIKYQGAPHAERAYQAMLRLPSPLDRLEPMAAGQRIEGDPVDVVLILGEQGSSVRKPRQSVAISPDGRSLAAGGEGFAIKVWNLLDHPPGHEIILKGHSDAVRMLSFSPDGRRLLSAAFGLDRTARVWDLDESSELLKIGGLRNTPSITAAFSPDGQFVLAGGERNLSLWKVADRSMQRQFEEPSMGMIFAVCFCPDGKRALAAGEDRKLHLWDVEQGKELLVFGGHDKVITGVSVSPDGRTAFSGSEDGTIRAWDLATGEETRSIELEQSVVGLGLTLDGRLLAACTAEGTIAFWEVPSFNPVRKLHLPGIALSGLAFAPDGRHVAVATRHNRTVVLRLPR